MSGRRHTPQNVEGSLADCPDRQFGFRWPLPLDMRLDQLVERAAEVGEKTNRRELLAALLLNADYTAEELSLMIRKFRLATVGDAVLGADGEIIDFPHHRPGPRTAG